jgi:opacity protein-like surface antigen
LTVSTTGVTATTLALLLTVSAVPAAMAQSTDKGQYVAVRAIHAKHHANNLEVTSPRVATMVDSRNSDNSFNAALAYGWHAGDNWRVEGELVIGPRDRYTSYWAPFEANANEFKVRTRRGMVNAYRDFPISKDVSLYASAGLGVVRATADGWQGNPERQFASRTQTNLAYSVGAGLSFAVNQNFTMDLGYRFVDMGHVETSFNTFANRINARDEQLMGDLVSHEVVLGGRFSF